MTGNKALLLEFEEKAGPSISYGDANLGKTLGYGNIIIGNVIIENVALVEGLKYNLLSVSQITDKGYYVSFFDEHCAIVKRSIEKVIPTGYIHDNIYMINIPSGTDGPATCLVSKASTEKSWSWHKKLSHLNFNSMNELIKKDLVKGLPKVHFATDGLCDAC